VRPQREALWAACGEVIRKSPLPLGEGEGDGIDLNANMQFRDSFEALRAADWATHQRPPEQRHLSFRTES